MSDKNKGKAYPAQCWAAIRTNQTIACDAYLHEPNGDDTVPPLMFFTPWSRFTISIIDNTKSETIVVSCNILAGDELSVLNANYLKTLHINNDKSSERESLSPAYIVTLRSGDMKGRTPAEILKNDPTKVQELNRTKAYLERNLSAYPKNQEVIDAIDDALFLLDTGKLEDKKVKSDAFVLLDKNFKRMGGNKVQAHIAWMYNAQNRYPYSISITNSDIKEIKADGTVISENPRSSTIYLSEEEMAGLIHAMLDIRTCFKMLHFAEMQAKSTENRKKPT